MILQKARRKFISISQIQKREEVIVRMVVQGRTDLVELAERG
jgi:hypothetical protein